MRTINEIRESVAQIVTRLGDRYIDLEDLLGERSIQPKDRKVNSKIKK